MDLDPFAHLAGVRTWGAAREMNAVETMFWRGETAAGVGANLIGAMMLDRAPDWDRLVERHRWVSRVAPVLRRRPVDPPLRLGRPFWVDDPNFDVLHHLSRVRLPSPGSPRQLLDFAQAVAVAPFDRGRPLWQGCLVEGVNGHGAVYLFKIHHSLTDGTGSSQLVNMLVDTEPEPQAMLLPPLPPHRGGARILLWCGRLLRLLARLPSTVLGAGLGAVRVLRGRRAAPPRPAGNGSPRKPRRRPGVRDVLGLLNAFTHATLLPSVPPSPLTARRSGSPRFEVMDLPFAALREAGKAAGGTFNDAYLAALAGGLDRYHQRFGVAVDAVQALLPISVRLPGTPPGGNHLASTRLVLPVTGHTPAQRVRLIHDLVMAVRTGPTLHGLRLVSRPITPLPPAVVGRVTARMLRGNDLLASNFAGIPHQVYLAGARATGFHPYPPLLCAAVSVALVTYQGRAQLGLNLDSGSITEPEVFMGCLREGFEEVLRLASPPAGAEEEQPVAPAHR